MEQSVENEFHFAYTPLNLSRVLWLKKKKKKPFFKEGST